MQEILKIAHYSLDKSQVQNVKDHSEHVAKMASAFGESVGLANCCHLAGILHDIGKYSNEFQDYIKSCKEDYIFDEKKIKQHVDHGKYGAKLILKLFHNNNENNQKMLTAEIIALVICYHHGGLPNCIENDFHIRLLDRIDDDDNILAEIEQCCRKELISDEELKKLFNDANKEIVAVCNKIANTKISGEEKAFLFHIVIKNIYSCLVDADRCDTRDFMNKPQTIKACALENWNKVSDSLTNYVFKLNQKKTYSEKEEKIKLLRDKVWSCCNSDNLLETKIYKLTVATGGGKTLSSFRLALNQVLAEKTRKKRIIYILPYTTIIEQNAETIRSIVNGEIDLLEHHCNVNIDVEKSEIDYRELLSENWDCPIIFSTMVQFLNIFYTKGTQSIRRMHNLMDAVIIFDEVQSIPSKCISLFNEVINYLNQICNSTIVLCSATQPNLSKVNHPVLESQEINENMREQFAEFKRMNVHKQEEKISLDDLNQFVLNKFHEEGSLLAIMNTKKLTEDIYQYLKDMADIKDNIYYLSTNLCPKHRKEIIKEIKTRLENKDKIICVSTPLIEAGVDISFDVVIRHLTGMDSIAQASGRGNRNGSKAIGNTYLVDCYEERLGGLKEIEIGEKCSQLFLNDFTIDSKSYDEDLLSPQSIEKYFDYYYTELSGGEKMDYPLSNHSTLFKLLGLPERRGNYSLTKGGRCPLQIEYAFEDASANFNVIDEITHSVLVPYGEGKTKITNIMNNIHIPIVSDELRNMQMYMVNCYDSQLRCIDSNNGIALIKDGICILKNRFYDRKLGIIEDGMAELDSLGIID